MERVSVSDLTFLDGRLAFVWTPLLPWRTAHVFAGSSVEGPGVLFERVREQRAPLRTFSTGRFAVVMVAFPALVLTERFSPSVPMLVLAFAVAWAGTLVTYFVAHRRVHGAVPRLESWLVLALSPVSLIRAAHTISFDGLEAHTPCVAPETLCGDEEFLRIARLWLFDSLDDEAAARGTCAVARAAGRSGTPGQRLEQPSPAGWFQPKATTGSVSTTWVGTSSSSRARAARACPRDTYTISAA
jgi:hypothetical protein